MMMSENYNVASRRPFLRSAVARSMYNKIISEQYVKNFDKTLWYKCDLEEANIEICNKFLQLSLDGGTEKFLDRCHQKSDWLFTHMWHTFAKIFLCWFMTQTSMNGLLGRGSMHVFSTQQFIDLLGIDSSWKADSILDLGAGDGEVTSVMAPFFNNIYTTEVSPIMRKILTNKGYNVLHIDGWIEGEDIPQKYDVISCLNLLDRCDKPISLLKGIKSKLAKDGFLIVALVLPVSQFVESNKNHKPSEELEIAGKKLEDQIPHAFKLFNSSGFEVVRWTKVPYLCEGDLQQPYYWLSDSIFILKNSEYC